MTTHQRSVEHIEQALIPFLDEISIDLSARGELTVERLSTPAAHEIEPQLMYHVSSPRGVTSARLCFKLLEGERLTVDVELSIKKFVTPTLSLSSAHIAVLISQLKRRLSRSQAFASAGSEVSWEFDRVKRHIRSLTPYPLTSANSGALLMLVSDVLVECTALSLSVLQEEAEYCRVIEQWRHARRAYLTWDQLSDLSFDQVQAALSVLYHLRDWLGCVHLLESSRERFDHPVNAQLAHAACILYRDALKRPKKALALSEAATALAPTFDLYRQTRRELSLLVHGVEPVEELVDEPERELTQNSIDQNSIDQNSIDQEDLSKLSKRAMKRREKRIARERDALQNPKNAKKSKKSKKSKGNKGAKASKKSRKSRKAR